MPINALTREHHALVNRIKTPIEVTNIDTSQTIQTFGVWDTGAQCSVMRQDLVDQLGLVPRGFKNIKGVTGEQRRNTYLANVTLNNKEITLDMEITGVDAFSDDTDEGMLIGMDIISQGDFCITNFQRNTVMTFRKPSQGVVDYCKENDLINKYAKIHLARIKHGNKLCPCGSKKLYENCHGKIYE